MKVTESVNLIRLVIKTFLGRIAFAVRSIGLATNLLLLSTSALIAAEFTIVEYSPWASYTMSEYFRVGDFNGDKRDDVVHILPNVVNVWLSNGNGTFDVKPFRPWN